MEINNYIEFCNKIEQGHHSKGTLQKQSNKHQNSQKTLLKAIGGGSNRYSANVQKC